MADYTLYNTRINANGLTQRDRLINNQKNMLLRKLNDNPALRDVELGTVETKIDKKLVIISTDDPNIKKITSLPNETFNVGNYVVFEDVNWIINKADADDEIYVDGSMTLCPNMLKFQDYEGNILSYPYFVDSSSPSLDENKMMSSSDTQRKIKLRFDQQTQKFFIDKRFMGKAFNGEYQCWKITDLDAEIESGLLVVTLQKDKFNAVVDNTLLGICDYFIPKEDTIIANSNSVEITYAGKSEVIANGSAKNFIAVFKDQNGNVLNDIIGTWQVTLPNGFSSYITTTISSNTIKVKVKDVTGIVGSIIGLKIVNGLISDEIQVKVRSLI